MEATGGIYISSNPAKIQIELDGEKIKNEAGILQRGTLIDNLLPREYSLNVKFDGYSPWEKNVKVKSGTVSVFDSIILVPEIEPAQISESSPRKIVSSGKHLAVEAGGGVSLDETLVFGHEIVILTDSGTLLTKSTATDNYYLANAFEPDDNLNLTLMFNNLKSEKLSLPGAVDIKKALPYPYNDRRFIVATNQALYVLDVDKQTIEQITLGINDFFIQDQNSIAWIEDQEIKMFNLPLKSETVALDLNSIEVEGSSLKEVRNTPYGWLTLNTNDELVIWNRDNVSEVLATGVQSFLLSPNGEHVAVLGKNDSLVVYNFENEETSESLDIATSVRDFAWFKDSTHIILLKGETLIFAEVSETGPGNNVTLAEGVSSFSYPGGDTVNFSNASGVWEKIITD